MTHALTPKSFDLSYFRTLSPSRQAELLSGLTDDELQSLRYDWAFWARPEQRIPEGDWVTWLVQAGRGFGKTRTGAETVREWARDFTWVNLIAPTADDARDIMVEGESGILAICHPLERPEYQPSKRRIVWPNGSVSMIFTADEPERLRGKQHMKLWCDELGSWRYQEDAWDQAMFGLRLGNKPQAICTTTPRPTKLIRQLIADPSTIVTNGSTYDNRANLADAFYTKVIRRYEGTRLGRQEIKGELLDDNPHALFHRKDIDVGRVEKAPELRRVVIGVDPAATSGEESDETGIVAVGVAAGGDHCYVLDDKSCRASPAGWARQAVLLLQKHKADRIVAEVNNGGEMVISTIRSIDDKAPTKSVSASRGKAVRAEPVAALYEQHRVHHVGSFAVLEDQMCDFDPLDPSAESPDRMDALVWAITELVLGDREPGIIGYYERIAAEAKRAAEGQGQNGRTPNGRPQP